MKCIECNLRIIWCAAVAAAGCLTIIWHCLEWEIIWWLSCRLCWSIILVGSSGSFCCGAKQENIVFDDISICTQRGKKNTIRTLTKRSDGDYFAHHAIAQCIAASHLKFIGWARRKLIDCHLCATSRCHRYLKPFCGASATIPDGVILFVFGTATIAGHPAHGHCVLVGGARDIVWCVWLCALNYQLGCRYDSSHFVRCHALIVAEIGALQILNGYIATGCFDAITLQLLTVWGWWGEGIRVVFYDIVIVLGMQLIKCNYSCYLCVATWWWAVGYLRPPVHHSSSRQIRSLCVDTVDPVQWWKWAVCGPALPSHRMTLVCPVHCMVYMYSDPDDFGWHGWTAMSHCSWWQCLLIGKALAAAYPWSK